MRRITITAALAAAAVLALAGTASADIGDIDFLDVERNSEGDGNETAIQGTAETAEVEGRIRCTTTIDYGLIVKVSQPEGGEEEVEGDATGNDGEAEGVGAFGPNQGNEGNSPCSSSLQPYEVVIQRNRDSGTFDDNTQDTGVLVMAGTSAENGDRGPGPFVGDLEETDEDLDFERTDP
jgi:hypothetical protein